MILTRSVKGAIAMESVLVSLSRYEMYFVYVAVINLLLSCEGGIFSLPNGDYLDKNDIEEIRKKFEKET